MNEKQAADLLWEEWKYRHDLFWKSLFRWAGAVVVLWVVPFLKPEIFKFRPWIALIFPAAAIILSLFSAWILGAEQGRLAMVSKKYDELRKEFLPPRMPKDTRLNRFFGWPIGRSVVFAYGFGFAALSLVVGYFLWLSIEATPAFPIYPWGAFS
jgi:hypothetical protein